MSDSLTELEIPETGLIDEHDHGSQVADTPEEQADRPRSPREEMMAQIARRRAEAINLELKQGEEYADEARRNAGMDPLAREDHADHAEEAEVEKVVAKPVAKPVQAAPEMVDIEIDGQRFRVTQDQMRELATVGARTNVALQRHNQQQQVQPEQRAQPQPRQPAPQAQPARSVLSQADADAVADRILYGGREQVSATVKALADHIASQSRQEAINTDAIAREAARQAMEQTQLANDLSTISQEYPRLWSSRALGELAAVQLGHIRQENQMQNRNWSNLDSYREACNRVLDELGEPRPGAAQTNRTATQVTAIRSADRGQPTADRSVVLERKRGAPSQPTGIDRRASAAATVRPKSGSEIVDAMRKARGQMSMTS